MKNFITNPEYYKQKLQTVQHKLELKWITYRPILQTGSFLFIGPSSRSPFVDNLQQLAART